MREYIFKMPDIGEGVVEAEITQWHVQIGDRVKEDQLIADVMTDKATVELTAPVSGVIQSVGGKAGDVLAIGANLVVFMTEGTKGTEDETHIEPSVSELNSVQPSLQLEAKFDPKPKLGQGKNQNPDMLVKRPSGARAFAAPAVRKRASDLGFDLDSVPASGPAGRVTHADLDRAMASKVIASPTPREVKTSSQLESDMAADETRIKIIGLRRVIAQRMAESKRNLAHFTYVEEIDVTALEALRTRMNAKRADGDMHLTVLPFLIKALVDALKKWPQMNAHYMDELGYLSEFSSVHLGIATQTDNGLVVPVMRNAGDMTITDMASEIARLARGARDGTLGKDELTGATTTLTSLGPLGGIVTTPIINRPQTAIFGPNKIRPVVVMQNGQPVERLKMNFSISCDHRIIDGYDAAKMVQYIKERLEDPMMTML